MNNPLLNASRGGGASPPLFLKYSVSFHMRGILRSVTTAERGLGRKNVNHASCLTDMWRSGCVFLIMALSVTDQSVRSQLLILQVCMHRVFSSCGPHMHGCNVRVSRLIDILSFFLPSCHFLKINEICTAQGKKLSTSWFGYPVGFPLHKLHNHSLHCPPSL